jgi:hypothetical protein
VFGCKFRYFAAAFAGVLFVSAPRTAAAVFPDVSVECERLSPGQDDEFLARLRLLLRTADPEALPEKLQAECSARAAWIVWEGEQTERLKVEEGPNLVEALLDTVEEQLARQSERPEPADPAAEDKPRSPPPASPLELPPLDRPLRPRPESDDSASSVSARTPPASVGGLGFAVVGEYWSEPVDFGLGPRVEVGVGSGALALVLCETLRFGMGSDVDTLTFDTQGGLSWGAPFQPAHRFGLLVLAGMEWFTEFGGDGLQTESTPTLMVGGRVSQRSGGVAFWAGIDGIYRFSELNAGPLRFTPLLSVGLLLLVDSEQD